MGGVLRRGWHEATERQGAGARPQLSSPERQSVCDVDVGTLFAAVGGSGDTHSLCVARTSACVRRTGNGSATDETAYEGLRSK